jgi:general secretion pathway protein K
VPPVKKHGAILVILLWTLMAMSIICITFAKSIRVEANAVMNTRLLTSAYYLAQAGINETIYKLIVYRLEGGNRLRNQETELEPMDIELGKVLLETDIGDVVVNVTDEYGKININRANKDLLLSLLLTIGVDEEKADIISDSILDWRDLDEDHHLNGAESDYYLSLENPYKSKNENLATLEELLLIRGVDSDLFYGYLARDETGKSIYLPGLNQCFTVYGGSTGVNVNSAPFPVLVAIGFPPDMAQDIIRERETEPFQDQQDFTMRVPDAPGREMLKAPAITRPPTRSNYFSLISTAHINDTELKKTIFAVVRLNASFPLKHTIVYWNENYFMQEQVWE